MLRTCLPVTLLKWLLIKMKGIRYAERRNGSRGCFTATITCWSAYTHDECVTETRLVALRARSRHVNRVAVSAHVLGFPAHLQLGLHRKPSKSNITSYQKTANTISVATTFSWIFLSGFLKGNWKLLCVALKFDLYFLWNLHQAVETDGERIGLTWLGGVTHLYQHLQ